MDEVEREGLEQAGWICLFQEAFANPVYVDVNGREPKQAYIAVEYDF